MSDDLSLAVDGVLAAIAIPGPHPDVHAVVAAGHRREWPALWAALDHLRAVREGTIAVRQAPITVERIVSDAGPWRFDPPVEVEAGSVVYPGHDGLLTVRAPDGTISTRQAQQERP